MSTPDFDTFEEIIEANVEETLKPKDVESLYQVSGGSPTLAVLMHDVGVEYGEETMTEHYYSLDKAKTDVEKARATLKVILNGIRNVYESAKERNLALLALFIQPTAHEEIETFCRSNEIEKVFGRLNCSQNIDSYKRIVDIREELWVDRKRKFYQLNDTWKHMRLFVNALCDKEEEVKLEVKTLRKTLLDKTCEDCEQAGWISSRTLFAALDNIAWLEDKADEKPVNQALVWGRTALEFFPREGFYFLPIVLELTKDSAYDELLASAYADQLVERSSLMNFPLNVVKNAIINAERLIRNPSEDPAVKAHRAETCSAIAKNLRRYGIERDSSRYMEKAEKMVISIKDKEIRSLAQISVWLDIADFYTYSNPNEAWHWAEGAILIIEKVRENFRNYASNKFVIRFFKAFGGNVEAKLENHLNRWYHYAQFLLGGIFKGFDWLDDAEAAFKASLEYSQSRDTIHASQDYLARIRVIRDFQLESFEDLYNEARYYEPLLYPEQISIACAEYWLACLFLEKEIEVKERKEIEECTKTNLMVYTLLLGVGYMLNRKFSEEMILKAFEKEEKRNIYFGTSGTEFAKVLELLITNERGKAFQFALDISNSTPLLLFGRLFAELADSIQRGDEGEMKKALVKLFYYLV